MMDTHMGVIVKELRVKLGLSQAKLADKLGVSIMTVRRWEHGKCTPSKLAQQSIRNLLEENNL